LAGLAVGAYQLSRRPPAAVSPPLDAADAARLDADMGRHDR
jgi:hypothetical protein